MKKYFLMASLAFAAIAFVSCDPHTPTPQPSGDDSKVVLNQHEVQITVGEQTKLRAALNPIKDGVTINYSSTNQEVATVDASGIVSGVAAGTANIIASAEGYISDTCVVTVIDASDAFAWGGMGLFDLGNTALGEPYTWTSPSSGRTFLLQNFLGTYWVWSADVLFIDGSGFSGAGYMAFIECPVAIIQEGSPDGTPGYYIGCDLMFSDTLDLDWMGSNPAGSLTDPQAWGAYLFDSTYIGDGSFKGVPLHYLDWDNEQEVDFIGFIQDGWIGEYSNGLFYQMNITWFDMEYGYYGLKIEQNEAGKWQFVEPYEFADRTTKFYEQMPSHDEEVAPKKMMTITNEQQKRMLSTSKRGNTTLRMAK